MIILLNGTSSSGKSTLINALSKKLDELYFIFGVDKFLEPSMPIQLNMDIPDHLKIVDSSISAFNKALGIYASHIDNMIVDHVFQNPNWIYEVAESLADSDVFFVGVTAPLSVLEHRESQRADRQSGTARSQYEQMQKFEYDLLVDTSKLSPEEAADQIIKNLAAGRALKKYAR
ncbi:MAG: hypothetical protein A2622_12590 [Bdellovibrionales bacterium RIFCSPHIGHO2_01_FULL_40_29]|nr:MAG: hypothetical protein A2622_12590 [Bdellovibrionales bacterium RIFCSPHIGHO2_01_FULL_40_29]OFZ33468.1 MAG: hypothetical protein A3D17_14295 [Bdellovibrionales bacterium RIFCSPHIGHO2_02_FULL_40_15]